MNSGNRIWGILLKVSLWLIFILAFLLVKIKFGWDPVKEYLYNDSCVVIHDSIVLVESISIQDESMEIKINEPQQLLAQIEPADATNKSLKWVCRDTTVANVDSTGLVIPSGKGGSCVIVATSVDGSNKSDSIVITVLKEKPDSVIKVKQIVFHNSKGEIMLQSGSELKIDADALPKNATNKTLKWKSDKEGVATVNNGVVTGKREGNCTITVSSTDGGGVYKSIKVNVQNSPVNPIEIKGRTLEEKIKFCLSFFTNPRYSYEQKETVANDMKNLFAPDATINIIRGNLRDVKDIRRINHWYKSTIFDKITFVDIEGIDSKGRITVLNVQELIK